MFDQKGQIIIDKEELEDECGEMDADELMMTALDAGAEDVKLEEHTSAIISFLPSFIFIAANSSKSGPFSQ